MLFYGTSIKETSFGKFRGCFSSNQPPPPPLINLENQTYPLTSKILRKTIFCLLRFSPSRYSSPIRNTKSCRGYQDRACTTFETDISQNLVHSSDTTTGRADCHPQPLFPSPSHTQAAPLARSFPPRISSP